MDHDTVPQVGLAWNPVPTNPVADLLKGGLVDPVSRVAGQIMHDPPCQRPARPGPPPALLPARFVHPIRVMLKMNPGIANEDPLRRVPHDPDDRCVGHRPIRQDRFVALEVCAHRPVEAQDRAGGVFSLPERMGIL